VKRFPGAFICLGGLDGLALTFCTTMDWRRFGYVYRLDDHIRYYYASRRRDPESKDKNDYGKNAIL
jgi:hypothetical protein